MQTSPSKGVLFCKRDIIKYNTLFLSLPVIAIVYHHTIVCVGVCVFRVAKEEPTGRGDQTSKNHDCQNVDQVFNESPWLLNKFPLDSAKFQTDFYGSKRESLLLKRVDRKTVQSRDPNILSRISFVSGVEDGNVLLYLPRPVDCGVTIILFIYTHIFI